MTVGGLMWIYTHFNRVSLEKIKSNQIA